MKTFDEFILVKEFDSQLNSAGSVDQSTLEKMFQKTKFDISHLVDVAKRSIVSQEKKQEASVVLEKLKDLEFSFEDMYKSYLGSIASKDLKSSMHFRQAKSEFLMKLKSALIVEDPKHASDIIQRITGAMERPDADMNEVFGNVIKTIQVLIKQAEDMVKNSN